MRLSLRFIIPLLLVLGAFAYAVLPLVAKLTLQWFERDLDSRASLVANTVQEPLETLVRAGNRAGMLEFFTRITQDERLYAMAFCPAGQGQAVATPTLPATIRCDELDSFSDPSGHLLRSRSEEHTSELQSRSDLVCRLLLEKKKNIPAPDAMSSASTTDTYTT